MHYPPTYSHYPPYGYSSPYARPPYTPPPRGMPYSPPYYSYRHYHHYYPSPQDYSSWRDSYNSPNGDATPPTGIPPSPNRGAPPRWWGEAGDVYYRSRGRQEPSDPDTWRR
jgi:hypothetical protein